MRLGSYEVVGELGRGGIGSVLRARSPDGREVAIKILKKQAREHLDRFDRERRLLGELGRDAGFVPLLDAIDSDSGPAIVMELEPGGTLREKLARGPLAIDEAVSLARALATSMGRAHARGIIHRDLKPENVLFGADGLPLIADLGLAKHFRREADDASVSLSRDGKMVGTAGYMAPEQISHAKTAGPPADVFAIGAILHECVTGAPAFEGDSVLAVLAAIANGARSPVRELRPDAPRWLVAVIDHALAVDPAARHADGDALARALEPKASRGAPLALVAIAVACAIAVAIALHGSRAPRPPEPLPPPQAAPAAVIRTPPRSSGTAGILSATTTLEGEGEAVTALSGRVDDDLVGVARGASVVLWDIRAGTSKLVARRNAKVLCVARASESIVLGDEKGVTTAQRNDLDSPAITLFDAEAPSPVRGCAHFDQMSLVTACDDGRVRVWSPERSRPTILAEDTRLVSLDCIRGEAHVFGGGGETILFVPFGDRARATKLDDPSRDVRAVAFVRGERSSRAMSGGADGVLRIWELSGTPRLAATLSGHKGAIVSIGSSANGRRAATAGADGTLRLWDLERKRELDRLDLAPDPPTAVAFANERLVAGTASGAVRAYELRR